MLQALSSLGRRIFEANRVMKAARGNERDSVRHGNCALSRSERLIQLMYSNTWFGIENDLSLPLGFLSNRLPS